MRSQFEAYKRYSWVDDEEHKKNCVFNGSFLSSPVGRAIAFNFLKGGLLKKMGNTYIGFTVVWKKIVAF